MEELCLLIVGLVKYLKYNNIWICNKAIERKTCFVLLNASCIFDLKMFILGRKIYEIFQIELFDLSKFSWKERPQLFHAMF